MDKSKFTKYLEGESTSVSFFFYLPAGLVGLFAAFFGVLELPSIFSGNQLSYMGTWTLMVFAYFSSMLASKSDEEANVWNQGFVVEAKEKALRACIGVGLFAVTFFNSYDSQHGWNGFPKLVLQSLFVVGCYVLIIQAPWGSLAKLEAGKKATTKVAFDRYIIQAIAQDSSEWEQVKALENDKRSAIDVAHELSSTSNYKDVRVVRESGYRDVIYSPSKLVFGGVLFERLKL